MEAYAEHFTQVWLKYYNNVSKKICENFKAK